MKILRLTVILIFMLGFLSLCAQDAQNMQQSLMYRRGGGGIKATSIVSVTLGLVAGGVALYYHNEANKAYDEYKTAIDTQIAVDWYDKASQNDTMALIRLS